MVQRLETERKLNVTQRAKQLIEESKLPSSIQISVDNEKLK